MYESQHHINTSKNMARYKQVVRTPPPPPTGDCLCILRSQDHRTPPFEANRRLFIEWRWWQNYIARCIVSYGTYRNGRVSLRAQGTKRQVIFHCTYACPKINNDMLWVKVTGSLASLSLYCLASKILYQLGCHLLWLCGSVVNLLLFTSCERRWQGLSIIFLAAW